MKKNVSIGQDAAIDVPIMVDGILFRLTTLTVPTADRAAAAGSSQEEPVAAGAQCLSALGMIAVMLMVLPMQSVLEVIPLTLEEMAKEISKQLDEAVSELSKP